MASRSEKKMIGRMSRIIQETENSEPLIPP
jgi:hypothetical protein